MIVGKRELTAADHELVKRLKTAAAERVRGAPKPASRSFIARMTSASAAPEATAPEEDPVAEAPRLFA